MVEAYDGEMKRYEAAEKGIIPSGPEQIMLPLTYCKVIACTTLPSICCANLLGNAYWADCDALRQVVAPVEIQISPVGKAERCIRDRMEGGTIPWQNAERSNTKHIAPIIGSTTNASFWRVFFLLAGIFLERHRQIGHFPNPDPLPP